MYSQILAVDYFFFIKVHTTVKYCVICHFYSSTSGFKTVKNAIQTIIVAAIVGLIFTATLGFDEKVS